jgi:hypothetical protein
MCLVAHCQSKKKKKKEEERKKSNTRLYTKDRFINAVQGNNHSFA